MAKIKSFHFYVLLAGSLLGGIGTAAVLTGLSPEQGPASLLAFYLAAGSATMFFSALFVYWLRQRFGAREQAAKHFRRSIRQGAWTAILAAASLLLYSKDLFTWLNAAFLIIALLFLEGFFLFNEGKRIINDKNQNA